MWTVDDIKARWIEAADVEHRLRVKGLPTSGNAWPTYRFDEADRSGWDDQAKLDDLEKWQEVRTTKSDELSRWGEVYFEWTLHFVPENRRELLWAWSRCESGVDSRSFSKVCEAKGWIKSTSFLRVDRGFENLLSQLCNALTPFRSAAFKWTGQIADPTVLTEPTVENCARADGPKIHPPFRAEKPRHLLKTDVALAEFEEHLVDVNEQRRKAQLRRAKAMRGVPGEAEAA